MDRPGLDAATGAPARPAPLGSGESESSSSTEPDLDQTPVEPAAGRAEWVRLILASTARAVLATAAALLVWGGVPLLIGWHTTTVVTGSMEPRLHVGDLAVSRPVRPESLHVDQVILYRDPDHPGRLRLHRFVGPDAHGQLITKGDANPQNDSTPVDPAAVQGVGTLRIPFVAMPRVWWQEGRWLLLGATAMGLVGLLGLTRLDRDLHERGDEQLDGEDDDARPGDRADDPPDPAAGRGGVVDDPGNDPPRAPRRRARPVAVRVAVPVVAAVLVSTGVTQTVSYAAFRATTSNPGSKLNAASYYTCAAAIADTDPRVWYRFDETSGTTATDSSTNGRTGTYRGGYTLRATRSCPDDTGAAVTLNGSTGYVSTSQALTIPTTLSLETWLRTTTTRGGLLIGFSNVATGASSAVDRQLYLTNAGRISFGLRVNGVNRVVTSPGSYNDGSWHHVVATLSGRSLALYVDGEPVDLDTATASAAAFTGYVRVGYDTLRNWTDAPTSNFLAGTLDDCALYDRALTEAEIRAHDDAAT